MNSADRRLATILAADLAGYSRLMAEDEEGVIARLRAARAEVIDPTVADAGGRIIKSMGDGLLIEFASPVAAVRAAISIQEAMQAHQSSITEAQRLIFRVGINLGDVVVEEDDVFGDAVNVAARLEALAPVGGICVSGTVYDLVRGKVQAQFADRGVQTVKNIPEPVQVYELQASGVSPAAVAPARSGALNNRRLIFAGAALVVLLVAGSLLWLRPWEPRFESASESQMAFPLPEKPSIVVLPFNDLSKADSHAFFADGMTEDLITDLSKISGLFVIARNSSFAYGGSTVAIKKVAEDLGVRYVLEGSVRRAGDKIRVNAQLIDATSGKHVWADRFDGDVADVFAVQDQFVLRIVNALELKLTDGEKTEIAKNDTGKIDARAVFQQGWDLYSRFNEADNAKSVQYFKKAIELDPEYGRAYGALALVYLRGSIFNWEKELGASRAQLYRELVPVYLNQANKHETALTHVVEAMRHLNYRDQAAAEGSNRGTDDARREASQAIALQPNDPEAHVMMAWALIAAGKAKEGLNFVEAAMRLNPNHPSHYAFFASAAHYALGDLQQAAKILDQGIKRDPKATELLPLAASIQAQLGQRKIANGIAAKWLSNLGEGDQQNAIHTYGFPINWVNENEILNVRLKDGLHLASLPLTVTVAELLTKVGSGDDAAQVSAIRTIGWFGPEAAEATSVLSEALSSDHKGVRRLAAIALGKIGPAAKEAVPALKAVMDQPLIGYHARQALKKITEN